LHNSGNLLHDSQTSGVIQKQEKWKVAGEHGFYHSWHSHRNLGLWKDWLCLL